MSTLHPTASGDGFTAQVTLGVRRGGGSVASMM